MERNGYPAREITVDLGARALSLLVVDRLEEHVGEREEVRRVWVRFTEVKRG